MPTINESANVVADLVKFVTARVVPASLAQAVDVLGARSVRCLALELLSWLVRQKRDGKNRPLALSPDSRTFKDLPILLSLCEPLCKLLEMKDGNCQFRDVVPVVKRRQLWDIAHGHRPPIRSTRKTGD